LKQTKPIISACIISYNQQEYIAQAIEGALMQELDVPYEIVISDDCSTDATPKIIQEFAKKDSRIRVIKRDTNVGMHQNWLEAINACTGFFVALCEGDDFWTDKNKLAKQFTALTSNTTLSGCFTNSDILEDNGKLNPAAYVSLNQVDCTSDDLLALHYNPVPTCTLMFRKTAFSGFPNYYFESPFADRILHTLLILKGDYHYISQSTAVYRKHENGVWSGIKQEQQHKNMLKALMVIRKIVSSQKHKQLVTKSILRQLDLMLYHYRAEKHFLKYVGVWLQMKFV